MGDSPSPTTPATVESTPPVPHTIPIPVVDLSLPLPLLLSVLHSACSTRGFFYLRSHALPPSLLSRAFALSRAFFALPPSTKRSYLTNQHNRGYTPFDDETLSGEGGRVGGDTKEGFYIGVHRPPDPLHPLYGPNVVVSEGDVPGWEAGWAEYMAGCRAVAMRVVELLYVALHGGADDEGNWARMRGGFDDPMVTMRLLHYDERRSSEEEGGRMGAGAHTDWGMITLLATDDEPGLQIWLREEEAEGEGGGGAEKGRWVPVPPMEGAFIVNLGDMLERYAPLPLASPTLLSILSSTSSSSSSSDLLPSVCSLPSAGLCRWTNGVYRSTLHRVVSSSGRHRYSLPYFFEPDYDCLVQCLPSCCDATHPPLYPPTRSGPYLMHKYTETQQRYRATRAAAMVDTSTSHG